MSYIKVILFEYISEVGSNLIAEALKKYAFQEG